MHIERWFQADNAANTPNWDFISSFNNRKGLVIVEAKSHDNEFRAGGKHLKKDAFKASLDNHKKIGDAIEIANCELKKIHEGFNISRDRCYQLSNRVAFAWKIATLGYPVILIYLGFLKDSTTKKMGPPFSDSSAWNSHIKKNLAGVFPLELLGIKISCGKSYFYFFARHKDAIIAL